MAKRVNGRDITLKVNEMFFSGITDVDLSSSATVETSLIKADAGVAQEEIVGFEDKFAISGIVCINDVGEELTEMDWKALRAAYRAKTLIPFVYGMNAVGKPEITGNMRLMSWNEKSGSTGKATISCDAKIIQDAELDWASVAV